MTPKSRPQLALELAGINLEEFRYHREGESDVDNLTRALMMARSNEQAIAVLLLDRVERGPHVDEDWSLDELADTVPKPPYTRPELADELRRGGLPLIAEAVSYFFEDLLDNDGVLDQESREEERRLWLARLPRPRRVASTPPGNVAIATAREKAALTRIRAALAEREHLEQGAKLLVGQMLWGTQHKGLELVYDAQAWLEAERARIATPGPERHTCSGPALDEKSKLELWLYSVIGDMGPELFSLNEFGDELFAFCKTYSQKRKDAREEAWLEAERARIGRDDGKTE